MTSKTPVFSSPPDITCVCKLSWLKQLNGTELKLLMVINGLAQEEGHCYASDEYLAGCLGVKVRTVEDGLKSLEEKKWIFRNSWAVHKGSKRKIIPKDQAINYWVNVLSKNNAPPDVKKRYYEHFFENHPTIEQQKSYEQPTVSHPRIDCKNTQKSSTPTEIRGSYEPHKSVVHDPHRNIYITKQLNAGARETTLESELLELGLDAAAASRLIAYWDSKPKELEGKGNAKGWLMTGVRQGWIWDKVDAAAAEKRKEVRVAATQGEEERRRHACFKLRDACDYVGGYKLVVQEKCMQVAKGDKTWILDFVDAQFEQNFENLRKRLYAIRDTRKADSVDESGAQGREVLRPSGQAKGASKTLSSLANEWTGQVHGAGAPSPRVSHANSQELQRNQEGEDE
jgi:hypothetical protein